MSGSDLDRLTTQPARPPDLGAAGAARWMWRQLTSMRVALFLLFLLAVAALPGSLFPQRGTAPLEVQQYLADNPGWGRLLDALSVFDVYAAPWFAAIYLLLMVSLTGCIVPRVALHWRAMRSLPPPAPRNLARLPVHHSRLVDGPDGGDPVARAAAEMSRRGFRVRISDDGTSVAGEKGYLRETGNLVFHVSLLVLLAGIAWGAMLGYKGTVLVVEGEGFSNTVSQFDTLTTGRRFDESLLVPFTFQLDALDATFLREGPRTGQPSGYSADVTLTPAPGEPASSEQVSVNHPLDISGTKLYLLGTGYAPVFTVTDGSGQTVLSGPVPTLPQDPAFTSTGVIKLPDARPEQLGIQIRLTPTAPEQVDPALGPVSAFPEDDAPRVYLGAWVGDLGLDEGTPQNIYQLQTAGLTQVGSRALEVGDTWDLPDGAGTVRFDGVVEWGNFQVANDPGRQLVLLAAVAAIAGVTTSLAGRRRRLWLRVTRDEAGPTLVEAAGLARAEDTALGAEVAELLAAVVDAEPAPDREEQEQR